MPTATVRSERPLKRAALSRSDAAPSSPDPTCHRQSQKHSPDSISLPISATESIVLENPAPLGSLGLAAPSSRLTARYTSSPALRDTPHSSPVPESNTSAGKTLATRDTSQPQ